MKFKFSLQKKIITLMILFAIILGAVSMAVCSNIITTITDENYTSQATELADTVAQLIDVDKFVRVRDKVLSIYNATPAEELVDSSEYDGREAEFEKYIAQFESVPEDSDFKDIVDFLHKIQKVNTVDYLYTICVDPVNKYAIYIIDGSAEDITDPGTLDPFYSGNEEVLTNPEIGFPAYTTKTEAYGWLVTAGVPIYDDSGNVVGYAMCDISMQDVRNKQIGYILSLLSYLIVTAVVICAFGVIVTNVSIIKPILLLSNTAESYYSIDNTTDFRKYEDRRIFSELKIHTGDEIEMLSKSMIKMENDINNQIKNIISMSIELTDVKHQADEMSELANKDSLTGLRNKTAYDKATVNLEQKIKKNEAEFGIVIVDLNDLKKINDNYGHEAGNAAIISLSKIICNIFVHSPVYRIGGDEFAVIIQNNDYKKIDELIKEFMDTVSAVKNNTSLDETERISAAIGYAIYSKDTDSNVIDVFCRADHEMYVCKRNMKEGDVR